ncbi:MAG TPA: S8 family serine peptidase [Opitutaceae bacterium]|nr:S8 family serine peptidase [Opitutaceae bacterium]
MHLPRPTRRWLPVLLVSILAAAPWARAADATPAKKPVHSVDDLPRHTYHLAAAPSAVIQDDAAFTALAAEVKKDLDADLAAYDIQDRSTRQDYDGTLLALALLNHDDTAARSLIAELRGLEEKPSLKLTTGLVAEALLDARAQHPAPADLAAVFQREFAALLAKLPWNLAENELKQLKSGFEVRSTNLLVGLVQQQIDPAALKTGAISGDVAAQLVAIRNQLVNYLPLKAAILAPLDAVVAAHQVVKPDRWTPTLVTLAPDAKASPVLLGIWDSGVDAAVFPHRVYTDAAGKHGFAFDLHANPSPDLLYPLGDAAARLPQTIGRLKGFIDLQAAIDSPDATALKQYMATLKPDEVKPTLEDLDLVENYAHGTHVTGIALAGNPFASIVIGRLTFDYHLIPEKPTIEQARKDAASYQVAVDYFKQAGVRAVNMSWGGSLKEVEDDLEANGAGGTAAERQKLAREIFDVDRTGLLDALKSAPGILFVVAAGNSDNNVKFDDVIPSSFQLPNLITVGAVDQAGEETSFSSFGPMVNVHADGFEVESTIPGGQRLKFSGTSMAAPQVTNLAGKLFALDPALTPGSAKALILAGCVKNGRVNLVDEQKSVSLLQDHMAAAK